MTEVRYVEIDDGDPSALHIGVAVASWNRSITEELMRGAVTFLERRGVGSVTVLTVPGSLELPVGAAALADVGCDAVVALGAVVKGDTDHYSIVVNESARGLTLVAASRSIPVTNGILAVHDIEHAVDRSRPGPSNKGQEAAEAAVDLALAVASVRRRADWV